MSPILYCSDDGSRSRSNTDQRPFRRNFRANHHRFLQDPDIPLKIKMCLRCATPWGARVGRRQRQKPRVAHECGERTLGYRRKADPSGKRRPRDDSSKQTRARGGLGMRARGGESVRMKASRDSSTARRDENRKARFSERTHRDAPLRGCDFIAI